METKGWNPNRVAWSFIGSTWLTMCLIAHCEEITYDGTPIPSCAPQPFLQKDGIGVPSYETPQRLPQVVPCGFYSVGEDVEQPICDLGGCDGQGGSRVTGFIDFNYYTDIRDFNTLTIQTLLNLPHDIEYFQFIDFVSTLGQPDQLEDITGFYSEIHLSRPIAKDSRLLKAFDWTIMAGDGSGPVEDVQRFGIRWRAHDSNTWLGSFLTKIKFSYWLDLHVLESDGSGFQIEHVYYWRLHDRVYLSAFCDNDINNDGPSTWVTEHQLGVKLFDEWHAVAEFRYNDFFPPGQKTGLGLGLQYIVNLR